MKTKLFLLFLGYVILASACFKKQAPEAPLADSTAVSDTLTKKLITARIFLKPEKVDDFIEAARGMIDSSNAEAGCESYMLYQNPYDPTRLIFVEVWKNQEAIDTHFKMPYFTAFGPKTNDWLSQPTELKIYDVLSQQ